MKKLLVTLVFSFVLAGAFARTWENDAGVGFSLPVSVIGVDEKGADDIKQIAFGTEGFYLGHHENGFTVKADYAIALTTTKDIHIQDHQTNAGFLTNMGFGVGYSFMPGDNFLISLTGMFGADVSIFKDSDDDVDYDYEDVRGKKADYDRTFSMVTVNVGADLFMRYKVGDHFGFFANFSGRYIIGGWGEDETAYTYDAGRRDRTDKKVDDIDFLGYFRVQPTIGVCWTF